MLREIGSHTFNPKDKIMLGKARVAAIAVLLSVVLVAIAYSHDVWLFPNQFILMRGDTLVIHQLAGTELDTEHDLPLLRTMTPRFELITPNGTIDLLAGLPDIREQPEVKPVLKRKLDFDGLALVTMEHAFIWEEFSREQFRENLEHEEFDLGEFEPHMGERPTQTERYARTLKCLVQVGSVTEGDLHTRVLGQKLEILLLENPYLLDPGDELDVQVLFEGEPLRDQLVKAYSREAGGSVSKERARTDENGIATFKLDRAGSWLIRLVHMLPCAEHPDVDCEEVDWESYWTSYSFELN